MQLQSPFSLRKMSPFLHCNPLAFLFPRILGCQHGSVINCLHGTICNFLNYVVYKKCQLLSEPGKFFWSSNFILWCRPKETDVIFPPHGSSLTLYHFKIPFLISPPPQQNNENVFFQCVHYIRRISSVATVLMKL